MLTSLFSLFYVTGKISSNAGHMRNFIGSVNW